MKILDTSVVQFIARVGSSFTPKTAAERRGRARAAFMILAVLIVLNALYWRQ